MTPGKWDGHGIERATHPPEGLFTKSAATIAKTLASPEVAPKGPASGLKMLVYYMNRSGKELTDSRRKELEKARDMLSRRVHAE